MSNIHEQYVYDPRYWMVGNSPNAIRPTGKFPIVAEQQWKSYQDALDFVNDPDSSAIPGSIITVYNENEPSENGIYFVESIGVVNEVGEIKSGKISKVADGAYVDEFITKMFNEHVENSEQIHNDIQNAINNAVKDHVDDIDQLQDDLIDMSTFGEGVEDEWETVKVGGINEKTKGEELKGKSIKEVLNDILFPTLYPTATQPSVSITYSGSTVFEVNGKNKLPEKSAFTTVPNRGSLTYTNDEGNKYYAGEATIGETTIDKDSFGAIVGEKQYTVTCKVSFAEGAQPLNNKGTTDGVTVVKYAGGTLTKSIDIYGVYPIYVNSEDITNVKKVDGLYNYIKDNVSFTVTIPQEQSTNKFEIHVPMGLKISVLQKNPVSGKFEGQTDMKKNGTTTHENGNYDVYVRDSNLNAGKSEYQITINKK